MEAAPLSRAWRVSHSLSGFYTGGRTPTHPGSASVPPFVGALHDTSLSCVAVSTSCQVLYTVESPSEEGFSAFALLPGSPHAAVTCGSDSLLLRHHDLESGRVVRSWRGHALPVLDMCADPTGTLVATASADRTARVWNVAGGFCTHSFRGHGAVVTRVAFHPDPKRLLLLTCAEDGDVRAWDLRTNKCHRLQNHMSQVCGLAFAGNTLVTGGRDRVLNVWSLDDFSHRGTLPVYEGVEAVLPYEGDRFLVGGDKGLVRVFNAATLRLEREHALPAAGATVARHITNMEWVGEGGGGGGKAPAGDGEGGGSGKRKQKKRPRDDGPGGPSRLLMVTTADHSFHMYRADTMERVRFATGFNDEIVDVRCVPDGRRVAVATNSENVRVFDTATFDTDVVVGHTDVVLSLDVSPCGRWLVTGSKDNTVRVWSLDEAGGQDEDDGGDGKAKRARAAAAAAAAAPTGRAASPFAYLSCVSVCAGHADAVSAVAFSRQAHKFHSPAHSAKQTDRRPFFVSAGRDRTMKLWDAAPVALAGAGDAPVALSSRLNVLAHEKDVNAVAVSPDDRLVATGSQDRTVKVWAAGDLAELGTLRGHRRGVWCVEFSPVDRVLASASGDRTIRVWSLSDHSCLRTLEGHLNSVLRVRWLRSGMQLMSSASDGVMKLWTVKTSECVNTFDEAHAEKVWSFDVTPDGRGMVSGGTDSVLNVWFDATEEERDEEAAEEQGRVLKEQELANSLRARDFGAAVRLALELEQPRRLLAALVDVAAAEDGGDGGAASMADVLRGLSPEQLALCVRYAREWNTNSRNCYAAHRFLRCLFSTFSPARLLECLKDTPGREEVLQSLALYSERHYKRVDRMLTQTYLLDYLLESMRGGVGVGGGGDGEEEGEGEGEDDDDGAIGWGSADAAPMWHEDRHGAAASADGTVLGDVDASEALAKAAAAAGAEATDAYEAAAAAMQGNWSGDDDDDDDDDDNDNDNSSSSEEEETATATLTI